MPPFDASAVGESRRARRARTKDALDKSVAAEAAGRAEAAARRAEQTGHAPTIALAWHLVGTYRAHLANLDPTPEHLDAAVDAMRKAAQGWPEGGLDESLPSTLALVGLLRAGPESPAVARVLAADGRIFSPGMLLSRAVSGDDGADALAALRRRPELQEAARLRKTRLGRHPTSLDVMLARIAGDPEMETAASAVFSRKDTGAELSIDARMAPGQEVEAYSLSFFQTGGKPAPAAH
jgi:cellulose synthase operon protein C